MVGAPGFLCCTLLCLCACLYTGWDHPWGRHTGGSNIPHGGHHRDAAGHLADGVPHDVRGQRIPPGLLMRRMRALQSLSLATSLSWLSTCRAIQDQSVAASAGHRIGRRQCRGMPLDCLQADAAVSWSWPQLLQQYKQIVKAGPLKE